MPQSDETWKTLRAAHNLSLATSFATLVLLLVPFEIDFRNAIREATLLKNLPVAEYEAYAQRIVGSPDVLPNNSKHQGTGDAGRQIVFWVAETGICCVALSSSPDWDVQVAVKYDAAPTGQSLQEWQRWITSRTPAEYWKPDWTRVFITFDTREFTANRAKPRVLRFFSLSPEKDWRNWKRPRYTFRAFFDDGEHVGLLPDPTPANSWWMPLISTAPERRDRTQLSNLHRLGRSIVEGGVDSLEPHTVTTLAIDTGSVNWWLRTTNRWRSFVDTDGLGGTTLPHLHEHWSVVGEKSLDEALAHMSREQRKVRDVTLLGVTVPGQLCIIAIPFVFLLCHLYLYLHLRTFRRSVGEPTSSVPFPWIGIYPDRLASIATASSLTLLPGFLLVLLVIRYWKRIGAAFAWPAIPLGVVAFAIGLLSVTELRKLRQRQQAT
jgi:hypothetical protein